MNLSEKRLKQINLFVAVIYALTLLYAFIINYESDKQAFYMGFVSILCPLIVPLLFRLFHFQPIYEIYIFTIPLTFTIPIKFYLNVTSLFIVKVIPLQLVCRAT